MTEPPRAEQEFDEVEPDLATTEELLTALAREDYGAIQKLRDSAEGDWWNVTWTLALLLRGLHAGEPSAVGLVDSLLGAEPDVPAAR